MQGCHTHTHPAVAGSGLETAAEVLSCEGSRKDADIVMEEHRGGEGEHGNDVVDDGAVQWRSLEEIDPMVCDPLTRDTDVLLAIPIVPQVSKTRERSRCGSTE